MTQYIAADQLSVGDRISVHGDAPCIVKRAPEPGIEPGFVYVRVASAYCHTGRLEGDAQYRLGTTEQVTLVRRHCTQNCGRPATCYGGGPNAGDWANYVCDECLEALGWIRFDALV